MNLEDRHGDLLFDVRCPLTAVSRQAHDVLRTIAVNDGHEVLRLTTEVGSHGEQLLVLGESIRSGDVLLEIHGLRLAVAASSVVNFLSKFVGLTEGTHELSLYKWTRPPGVEVPPRLPTVDSAPAPTAARSSSPEPPAATDPIRPETPARTHAGDVVGWTLFLVLMAVIAVLVLDSIGPDDPPAGNTCSELESWYDDNPGDSNVGIAKDYYLLCDRIPPPVLNGELTMDDIR